jgi:hypothetical protein
MTVIDVHTHLEISGFEPGQHPLEPWMDRRPTEFVDRMAHAVVGDGLS